MAVNEALLSECELFWVGGALLWVGRGVWGCMEHDFGWVGWMGVGGALFWVGGKLFWVSGGGWGWVGVGKQFDNALIINTLQWMDDLDAKEEILDNLASNLKCGQCLAMNFDTQN